MQIDYPDPLSTSDDHHSSRIEDRVPTDAQQPTVIEQPRIKLPPPDAQIDAIANMVMAAAGHGKPDANGSRDEREITARMNRQRLRRGHAAIAASASLRTRRIGTYAAGLAVAALVAVISIPLIRAIIRADRGGMVQAAQSTRDVRLQTPSRAQGEPAKRSMATVEVSPQIPPQESLKEQTVQPEITITSDKDSPNGIKTNRSAPERRALRGQIMVSEQVKPQPRIQLPEQIYPDTTTDVTVRDRKSIRDGRTSAQEAGQTSNSASGVSSSHDTGTALRDGPRVVVTVREEPRQKRSRRTGSRSSRLDPWDDHSPGDVGGSRNSDE